MQRDQRVLAQVGRLAGHVGAGDDGDAAAFGGVAGRSQSLATNGSPACLQRRLDHRMAAALDPRRRARRRRPAASSRASPPAPPAPQRRRSRRSPRRTPRKTSPSARHAWRRRSKASSSSAERAVGGRGDLGLELDERVGGEAQRPRHGLAMDEGRVERRLQQRLALRLRRLDVVAEQVVVLDLELPDAGLLGVGAPASRRSRAGSRRAARALRRAAGSAPARTKPPSRLTSGRSSASVAARSPCRARRNRPRGRVSARRSSAGSASAASQDARERGRRGEPVANGGEVARAAAVEAEPRQRAQEIRRALRARPAARRAVGASSTRKPTASSRRRSRRGRSAGSPDARPAAARRPASRSGRWSRAASPRARPPSVRVSSRLARVAGSISRLAPRAPPGRRRERRPRLELRPLDVGERQRRRGDFGAREGAETVEGLDAVELAHPQRRRGAVAGFARERRQGTRSSATRRREMRLVADRLRRDDLARLEARDLGGEARLVRLRERERAGREVERGEAEARAPVARRAPAARRRAGAPGRARAGAPR